VRFNVTRIPQTSSCKFRRRRKAHGGNASWVMVLSGKGMPRRSIRPYVD